MKGFFVTGTDTEVGKTRISVGLMGCLQQQGLTVAGMKPVASGCESTERGLRNEDALALMLQANVKLPYQLINPFAFEPAIAPHIAAQQQDETIDLAVIRQKYDIICQKADAVVVEGAGGWLVPLNEQQTMADLAAEIKLPIVLVVGIRLGCINHALLTAKVIQQQGLPLAGWVANELDNSSEADEMVMTLTQRIDAPCLGRVPYLQKNETSADYLQLDKVAVS